MAIGLIDFLRGRDKYIKIDAAGKPILELNNGFYLPGFWVAAAIAARDRQITKENIILNGQDVIGYSSAIGLSKAICNVDDYIHERKNEGQNYSCLTLLENRMLTDDASSTMNSCIRNIVPNSDARGVRDLCHVVGELHDNVWSHGEATGISMAQFYPNLNGQGPHIQFAIADGGKGFRRELQEQDIHVNSNREAIEWCIVEGNSSKHADKQDEWAQSLPFDALHNPFGEAVAVRQNENNHQGLGLYQLINLVNLYSGELHLVTGNCLLYVDKLGRSSYIENMPFWRGVAIVCTLCVSNFERHSQQANDTVMDLMKALREQNP